MTATDPRPDYAAFTRALIDDHRAHGGRITFGPFKDRNLLLLHTIGARSGEPRLAPVVFSRDGDRLVVVASKGGAPENPSWFENLLANPEAEIQVKGETIPVRASTAEGEERSRLWSLMTEDWPAYDDYQTKTSREIPVVVLSRR